MELKRYIVTDKGFYIDTETYGLNTWGANIQYSIEIINDNVYINYWSYGGNYYDDVEENTYIGKVIWSDSIPLNKLDNGNFGLNINLNF